MDIIMPFLIAIIAGAIFLLFIYMGAKLAYSIFRKSPDSKKKKDESYKTP
ncbi:hypothetical protein MUO14_20345 [Halobacillus shinanisalinarum]|uniref:DUF3951 domain-containing protein n=1 Tax=Halobacillus shinanisalinarum TaxID=2932258 RepID=A0ABY4GX63_9BACI|nr:hypothetical protein [Halobacillus shinanisalinarum]UOQ92741.1 hypothetical protein MUO14_20345 [Halobacillus shinanisalinarum]